MPDAIASHARGTAEEKLGRLERLARDGLPSATTTAVHVAVGDPHVEIIRRARYIKANLVLVGREGKIGLRNRIVTGSTPKRVVRKSETPVLVVRQNPLRAYRRPMVAVDLSEVSPTLIRLARIVVGTMTRRGTLLHAFEVPFAGWLKDPDMRRDYEEQAAVRLRRFHSGLGSAAARWRPVIRQGDPRLVVLSEATRGQADLIIVGTHGRAGVSHALIGSVSEFIASEAECDVAITRPTSFSFELP
jgi:nucleotide-binding universal stress UspA family protein